MCRYVANEKVQSRSANCKCFHLCNSIKIGNAFFSVWVIFLNQHTQLCAELTSSATHHHAANYITGGKARLARRMVLRHIPLRGVSSLNLLCSCQCEDWNHPPLTLHVICPKTFRFDQFFQLWTWRRLGIYSGGEITIFISIAVGVAFTYPSENNSGWPSNYQFSGNFHFFFARFLEAGRRIYI